MVKLAVAIMLLAVTTAAAYNGPLPPMTGWHEAKCGAPEHLYRCWVKDKN